MFDVWHEAVSGGTAERRRTATVVADQYVVSDHLVSNPLGRLAMGLACLSWF